jgi:hypothetical protein
MFKFRRPVIQRPAGGRSKMQMPRGSIVEHCSIFTLPFMIPWCSHVFRWRVKHDTSRHIFHPPSLTIPVNMPGTHVLLQYGPEPWAARFEDLEGRLAFTMLVLSFQSNARYPKC